MNARAPRSREQALHDANERTFLAWIRTATAILLLGCALAELGLQEDAGLPAATSYAASGAAILVAMMVMVMALRDFRRRRAAIISGMEGYTPTRLLYFWAALIALISLALSLSLLTAA